MDYSERASVPAPRAGCSSPIRGVPPRAIIPGLLGKGPVFLLSLVRDRADVLRVTFVNKLGAEQSLLGRRVPNVMLNAKSADPLALLRHVNDEAIVDTARSAGLIVNRLDGRGDNLEVVVGFKSFVHLRMVPQLFEKARDDAEEGRYLGEQPVGRAVANGYGEEAVCTHFWASCHGLFPRGVVDRPAHVQRREDPRRFLQYADPVLPHSELLPQVTWDVGPDAHAALLVDHLQKGLQEVATEQGAQPKHP